ncbi:hypothetical protein [Nesterenkonia ebinurensis]|uniref:hypothetical protein n=1 Tax=Nesterenkonia ebinurensis TaxID=2608252 RepID=UPI00123D4EB9|nr:hypothetical protein [Nesterenkonia ebinurensis]
MTSYSSTLADPVSDAHGAQGRFFEYATMLVFAGIQEERHAWLAIGESGLRSEPHYERYRHILADLVHRPGGAR